MSDRKTVPLFRRPPPREQTVAGVSAVLAPGGGADAGTATWLVRADSLGGLEPRAGDRLRGTDGAWWAVTGVAPLADGAHPCLCAREGGE